MFSLCLNKTEGQMQTEEFYVDNVAFSWGGWNYGGGYTFCKMIFFIHTMFCYLMLGMTNCVAFFLILVMKSELKMIKY